MNVYKSIRDLVGNTPIIELSNLKRELNLKCNVYAKIEYFNPTGSIKDRIALAMLLDAKENGLIKEGATIIEPTSGNTGIGLCAMARSMGYKCIIVMPESMSIERRKFIKAYGGEVILTDKKLGMKGAIDKAIELKNSISNSFMPSQFENMSNPNIHYQTTGKEIYDDLDGNIDVFIAGIGTGGTISGVGAYLKSKNPNIKIIGIEPSLSPVITKGYSGAHLIQGIGAGFIPKTLDTSIYDEIVLVDNNAAFKYMKFIANCEGLFVGISSGAALATMVEISKREEFNGKNIVVLLPDSGDRYLSLEI